MLNPQTANVVNLAKTMPNDNFTVDINSRTATGCKSLQKQDRTFGGPAKWCTICGDRYQVLSLIRSL